MTYKITNVTTGEERTLAEWGIDDASVQLRIENLATDYLTFTTDELFDATPQFASGAILSFSRVTDEGETTQLFYGRVDKIKRTGTGETEGLAYAVAGPWHWLERTVYVGTWTIMANPLDESEGTVEFENSHVILMLKADGTKVKTAEQIRVLMEYMTEEVEAPLQYDATDCPDVDMPFDEVRDMSPAECIRRLLKMVPNCTSWFDYSTTPPTLKLKQRTSLTERNLTTADIDEVELDERHDLLASGVIITYEKTHRLNGIANTVLARRPYPANASAKALNAITASVSLEGGVVNEVFATYTTEAAPAGSGTATEEFWTAREQTISQENVAELTLGETQRETDAETYPYVVTGGQVPEWAAQSADDNFKTTASYKLKAADDPDKVLEVVRDEPLAQRVTVVNKAGGTYRSTVEVVSEEPEPVGLETAIYNAMSQLHYDGVIVVSNDAGEVDPSLTLGQVVNITDMRAEWATMKAQIQSIVHDFRTGQTTLRVGPPRHLGINDIIEILRTTRFRMRWTSTITPTTGRSTAGTKVELNGKTEKDNTQKGRGELDKMTIGRLITLDKEAVFGKTIAFREVKYCDEGTERYMLVLGSELYDTSLAGS